MDTLVPDYQPNLAGFVKGSTPLVCLTAYTASMARVMAPYVDLILVGDSVGMVVYGHPNTLSVTMDMMVAHGAAVVRGAPTARVVVDMPYGSYEQSPEHALRNARRLIDETGALAVKLEGGRAMAPTISLLVENGVPVMGHVGLMPQSIEKMGGFKIQGRDGVEAAKVKDDAIAVAETGAFAVVIEGTVEPVAHSITQSLSIPTIGIGASPACAGQILVIDDVLGMTAKLPRFAKAYADMPSQIAAAVKCYAEDVRAGRFPAPQHCFGVS